LSDQRNETGGGENETDIDLRPLLSGQKDRDERTKAGLNVGNEEDEPIEPAQAVARRGERRLAAVETFGRRRRIIGNSAAPISIVAETA
jgi:hypothetical protein